MILKRISSKYIILHSFGYTIENVRNPIKKEFFRKYDNEKVFKQQSKLSFNGIHKPYTKYDSYTFKLSEFPMSELFNLVFAKFEISNPFV